MTGISKALLDRRAFSAAVISMGMSPVFAAPVLSPRIIRLTTALGAIDIELDLARAPVTAGNFLKLIVAHHYDAKSSFYRAVAPSRDSNPVPITVIQGGFGTLPVELDPIEHESTARTGLTHKDGSLSMARAAPGTAAGEFFICIGANPELDAGGKRVPDGEGCAVFGQVIRGMEIVRKIHAMPAGRDGEGTPVAGQILMDPVEIMKTALLR